MSALQKLAVAREVGTSRPATAASGSTTAQHSSSSKSTDTQQGQQATLLHPLLQSLNFPFPASTDSTSRTADLQLIQQPCSSAVQRSSTAAVRLAGGSESTQAAALADALKQKTNNNAQLNSSSVQQLLASFAAVQQEQNLKQLKQACQPGAVNKISAHLAVVAPDIQDANEAAQRPQTSSSSRRTRQGPHRDRDSAARSQTASGDASVTPGAAAARRHVTAHATKPYRPGSIKTQLPGAVAAAGAFQQHAACLGAAATTAVPASSARPCTTGCCSKQGGSRTSSSCCCSSCQPLPAAIPAAARPGTAAAFRILRAMGVTDSTHRPASSMAKPACASRPAGGVLQPQGEQHTSTLTLQQQQLGPGLSRPVTAELRALLASSHSKDGIAERLEHYRRINSSNDHTDGLDIVHEEGSDAADDAESELPDWLKPSAASAAAAACQAAPMVLNVEDPCMSTPEVLQQELAQQLDEQLDSLDMGQLLLLKDAVCRHIAS